MKERTETAEPAENQMRAQGDCFPYPSRMLPWFYANRRDLPWRGTKDAYAVWVSEIMLQQTRVETVRDRYVFFMRELPTVQDLACCDDERLMKLWEGLGYYSRARNMKRCAQTVVTEYGGIFPAEKELLRKLPGIGEYTAGAISSIAYGRKSPAIDGNVLRVCARCEGDFTPIGDAGRKRRLYRELESVYPEEAGDYTQSLMELGALVCLPETPSCTSCPLQGHCMAEREGWQRDLPVMPQKTAKRTELLNVFILCTPGGVLLCKREGKGVLAGMWQFPNMPRDACGGDLKAQLAALGVHRFSVSEKTGHTHVFTHLIWDMTAYAVATEDSPRGLLPFALEDVERDVSLPSAFRWGLALARQYYGAKTKEACADSEKGG